MISFGDALARISVGDLWPRVHLSVAQMQTPEGERVALGITLTVVDADRAGDAPMPLYQCYPVPQAALDSPRACAQWVLDRVQDVVVHELEEHIRLDGERVRAPAHPLPLK